MNRRTFARQSAASAAALALTPRSLFAMSERRFQPGHVMMIDLPGTELSEETIDLIRTYGIRGVCLFQRNIRSEAQARGLIASLRAVIGPGALIGIDQEGGGVIRTRTFPFPPSAMGLGATRDEALAERVGAAVGRGLRSLGLNWNFAPSLDVNNNPLNPVIGDRSFGSDPDLVQRMGLAWARGLESSDVAPCVKHFPGHGDTVVDSHYGLPSVPKSFEELSRLELLPFEAAARANVACFMTAHIIFPALDPEHPATLSRPILTGLLRERWGYDGVVTTDSMSMQAIADRYGRGEAALLALNAGADLVMALGSADEVRETADSIARAHARGHLREGELREKTRRLDALAARFPLREDPYPESMREQDSALMLQAWTQALTTHGDAAPPPPGTPVTLVVSEAAPGGGASDPGLSGPALTALLSSIYDLRVHTYDASGDPNETLESFDRVHRAGTPVLLATTSRRRPTESFQRFARALRPDLHLALWNPYSVLDVPAPALVTFGFRPEGLQAATAWLRGEARAEGRFPVEMSAG